MHEDYARLLLPRAVGYSAALLDYFFRGRLDVDLVEDPTDPSLLQLTGTNASSDPLVDGTLTLYSDDPAGVRSQVPSFTPINLSGVPPAGAISSPAFLAPANAERFVAVYTGTLGQEAKDPAGTFPGGVIGKVLGGVRVEEVFLDFDPTRPGDPRRWKLRTPRGVFPLTKEGDLPLTEVEFEDVRWGDGDSILVARAPLAAGQPIRVVAYEVQRQPGSVELLTVGGEVPLRRVNEALYPPGPALPVVTTVTVANSLLYSQRIAMFTHTDVFATKTINGSEFCEFDHTTITPVQMQTATSGTATAQGSARIVFDLAHNGDIGTDAQPYVWFLQDVHAAADGRLLGLAVVFLTFSAEGPTSFVPIFGVNQSGVIEQQSQTPFLPFFPPEVSPLLWALIDLQTGQVLASTAASSVSLATQEVSNGFPDVWENLKTAGCGGDNNLGWFKLSAFGRLQPGDIPADVTDVTTQGGLLGFNADGWYNADLAGLDVNGQALFRFRLATFGGVGDDAIYDCARTAGIEARSCYALRETSSVGFLGTSSARLEDARRSRPAPGHERLVFVASLFFGAQDTVLMWDPGQGPARALRQYPALGENSHVIDSLTGALALVSTLGGGPFDLLPLEGSAGATSFSNADSSFFTLLHPRFLFNKAGDLKFYRLQPPLQATALPAKLADLSDGSNPVGDYHAIRVP